MSCRHIPLFIIVLKVSLDGIAAIPNTTTPPFPTIAANSENTETAVVDDVGVEQTRGVIDTSKTLQNNCRLKSCSQLIPEEQLEADSIKTDVIVHIEAAAKSNHAAQVDLAQVAEVQTLDNTNTRQTRFSDLPDSTPYSRNTPLNHFMGTHGVVATDSGTRISVHTAINITKGDEARTNAVGKPNFITQPSYPPGYLGGIPAVPQNLNHPLPHQHFQRSGDGGNFSPFVPLQEGPAYGNGVAVVPYDLYQPYPEHHIRGGLAPYVPHQRPEYTQHNIPPFRQEPYPLGSHGENTGPIYPPHPGFPRTFQPESDGLPVPERHKDYGNTYSGYGSYSAAPHMPPIWVAPNKYNTGTNENKNPWIQGYMTPTEYNANQDITFPNSCHSRYSNTREGHEGMLYLPSSYPDSRGVASDPRGIQSRLPLETGRMNAYPDANVPPHFSPAVPATEKNRIGNHEYNSNVYNLRRIPHFEPSYQNQHRGENPPPQLSWYPRGYVNNPVEFKDIPQITGDPSLLLSKLSDNCNSSTVLCKCEGPQNCKRSRRRNVRPN